MKHVILTILITALTISVSQGQFAGGSGTVEDPYQIETVEQLQAINDTLYLDKHFILVDDIDATETENWNDGKGFEPVGNELLPFTGILDGNGYIVSNLSINRSNENNVGLIGYTYGAAIKNIGLENVGINGNDHVGGLVGNSEIGTVNIQAVFVSGYVSGNSSVGGLVGSFEFGCAHARQGRLYSSYTNVNVSGDRYVGGLAGSLPFNTYIGFPCQMVENFAVGKVSGNKETGGLFGDRLFPNHLRKNYWNIKTTNQIKPSTDELSEWQSGSHSLFTDQMKGKNAWMYLYKFDFENAWQLTEGYPVLKWQKPGKPLDPPKTSIVHVEPGPGSGQPKFLDFFTVDFGQVHMNNSMPQKFTLTNRGNVTMEGHITLTDKDNTSFMMTHGGGEYSLESDSSHVFEIVFTPGRVDVFKAVLEIGHNSANEETPVKISLIGKEVTYTTVKQENNIPVMPALYNNYPNPFNPTTQIRFAVPEQAHVRLSVYNMLGQHVSTLVNETRSPGWHDVNFDASGLSSGFYMYRLEANGFVETRQMMFVK